MPKPLNRDVLDQMPCMVPGCTHEDDHTLKLLSRCHTNKGTVGEYDKRTGVLTIRCVACKKLIAEIAVQ